MRRILSVPLLAALSAIVLSQGGVSGNQPAGGHAPPYQPAVPAASTVNAYGGWSGNTGASTAAGSAMNGMASVISAKGDYNLSTSAAAINMTQAQRNEIENRQLYTNTYFEMRATNKAAREAEAGPQMTVEKLARMAREGAPKPLAASQFDPVSGRLQWPSFLQQPIFDVPRNAVDQLFAKFATYGGLPYAEQNQVRQNIDKINGTLKAQVKEMPPMDFIACRNFLGSVLYLVTKSQLQ